MNNIITDTSYTNKDFQSIYPELLDLATKLSNKWDPSLSNESDPGVVLLKLNALIADKNNYNIDKNVLECFPQSVTQYGNARKIYDLLGYNMNHYISATTTVNFKLKKGNPLTITQKIPQFTQLTDENKESSYVTLNSITLRTPVNITDAVSVDVIEGSIKQYLVNNESIIYLNNLDNHLRLYFEEKQVAQNGIFIRNVGDRNEFSSDNQLTSTGWRRVNNLASYPAGSKIYTFGVLPNSNTCYIQFPTDISSLIDAGLEIWYIISNGLNGNIKKNTLNRFLNNITLDNDNNIILNDYITITQSQEAITGKDPESLDEAYFNYKKTVGTFNTLVSKRDYENFIYNLTESTGEPVISNVKIADRTNDLNDTIYIQTRDSILNENIKLITGVNQYNVIPYMLRYMDVIDEDTYNNNFE